MHTLEKNPSVPRYDDPCGKDNYFSMLAKLCKHLFSQTLRCMQISTIAITDYAERTNLLHTIIIET